jgi:hypothetical protein
LILDFFPPLVMLSAAKHLAAEYHCSSRLPQIQIPQSQIQNPLVLPSLHPEFSIPTKMVGIKNVVIFRPFLAISRAFLAKNEKKRAFSTHF